MLRQLGISISIGMVSALIVVTIAQQAWGITSTQSLFLGIFVFLIGVVNSEIVRRMGFLDGRRGRKEDDR
jgi:hypothetical protein